VSGIAWMLPITFTAHQLVAHLVGDYLLQSDWMAQNKTQSSLPALAHSLTYTLPFLLLTTSWKALLFIAATHFILDRFRLARYVCWAKNYLAPKWIVQPESFVCKGCGKVDRENPYAKGERCLLCPGEMVFRSSTTMRNHPWSECHTTGYHKDRPAWLSVWLIIISDNTLHIICNGIALSWWG